VLHRFDISNNKRDCDKALKWKGGTFADPTAPGVEHKKDQTGVVAWDVTADVLTGADNGWALIREKDKKEGEVRYYSKESAAALGDLGKAPKLILNLRLLRIDYTRIANVCLQDAPHANRHGARFFSVSRKPPLCSPRNFVCHSVLTF